MDYRNMEAADLEREIKACKDVLHDTSEQILTALEGILSCTSATGIITFLKKIAGEVSETVSYRANIRQQMQAMQEALDEKIVNGEIPEMTGNE